MGNSSGHTKIIFEEPVVDNIPEVKTSTPAEAQKQAEAASSGEAKKQEAKACCACPETKKARDQCIIDKGEKNCKALIEAHKECMRKLGYNI